ncbi:tryptase beta-2-like [Brevipalpus obovatus]|uniref:tryptase beta-2-like n=1 Tax=Brevipalpus obovatus TaxID=246614 RepID=UPI003D9E1387
MILRVSAILFCVFHHSFGDSCECGLENIHNRIFNGEKVAENSYPWLAFIHVYKRNQYFRCAGSLIDDQHVVTAAHCVHDGDEPVDPSAIKVYLGGHFLKRLPKHITVESLNVDPDFKNDQRLDYIGHDMTILTLSKSVNFTRKVMPICIPADNSLPYAGQAMKIAGWGMMAGDEYPTTPREAKVYHLSEQKCRAQMNLAIGLETGHPSRVFGYNLPPTDICAMNMELNSDACSGDSGAPLMWRNPNNGRWYLIAVVSRGRGGCDSTGSRPGIYTSVSHYRNVMLQGDFTACVLPY